ncbi:putative chromosome-partitioning protein ParB [Nocardioides aquaticus]|jgi:ParB family chromosome partitioning protein|uniref:Chromosome-partitioning protein ParB n=1 Tax=Nocardioides aquaticus TaxID=160826 RepID=A0ABX8ENI4_9ACTN|nr:ParB/RepB/Spo0J family partition protein [Nocardioides aquaticus]QVT82063.1 putative chromosome-partitioning protein ParB [Nocardioides aquaticus]
MTGARPGPRRGLGRGLGSLIPTQAPPAPAEGDGTDSPDGEPGGPPQDATEPAATPSAATPPAGTPSASSPPAGTAPAEPRPDMVELAPVEGAYFVELPPEQIRPNRAQPRSVFDEEAMAELVHSVREIGLLQPIVVRRTGPESYELVMGERRWRASQAAGLDRIPAIVRETDDTDMLRDALLENLHRSQLNPLEEASAYAQLLEDFGITHEELAQRIGRSRPQISNTLRLLRLSPAVQRRVAAGVLSAGHARALLSVDDADLQDRLASRIVAEGISVRALEEIVAVGDDGGGRRSPARRRPSAPGLSEIADRLSDRFETRVKVDLGRSKGKITVEFASLDDLQRIIEVMDPRNRTDRPV